MFFFLRVVQKRLIYIFAGFFNSKFNLPLLTNKGGNMLHGSAAPLAEDKAAKRKSALGLKVFFAYMALYCGFVAIGLTDPDLMGVRVFFGLNLAIVYGFGLIIAAIVMGWVYHMACSRLEDKMEKEDKI